MKAREMTDGEALKICEASSRKCQENLNYFRKKLRATSKCLKEAEAELEKEKAVVDFYADRDNWNTGSTSMNNIEDVEAVGEGYAFTGGKRARQRQKERGE